MTLPQPVAPEAPRFPAALVTAATRVERRIVELLGAERDRWERVDPRLGEPLRALHDLVAAGGKRLRPAFCHAAFVGAGGRPDDHAVVDAGAALELVHTFALVHDDVMDGSATRRGRDTVHRRFAQQHEQGNWAGEPRRFGEGMAILVGDFSVVYADRLMRGAAPAALAVFDDLRVELCIGQALDLSGTARQALDVDTTFRVATYKSAKYTVERPLHLGAALAGRLDELAPCLSAVGLPLGQAFQLRDDVLGVFGDPARTGKPVGDDLREGKPTPMLALARDRLGERAAPLFERLGAPDLDDAEVAALQALLLDHGVVDEVERRITELVAEARRAIPDAPLAAPALEWLDDLAGYVAWRDR